jgi:hypothetical protein
VLSYWSNAGQQPFQFVNRTSRERQKDTSRPLATTGHFFVWQLQIDPAGKARRS